MSLHGSLWVASLLSRIIFGSLSDPTKMSALLSREADGHSTHFPIMFQIKWLDLLWFIIYAYLSLNYFSIFSVYLSRDSCLSIFAFLCDYINALLERHFEINMM